MSTATAAPNASPANKYATLAAVNNALAARGLRMLTANDKAAAFRARMSNIDHLYAALDAPTSHAAATAWLTAHLDAVLGPEGEGESDDLPQLPAPGGTAPASRSAPGITPQEGRRAPQGERPSSGTNPAADPSRNPANAHSQRRSAEVHDIEDARAARVTGDRTREFDQHCVFGRSAAIQFECSRHSAENPTLTVNLKAAQAKDSTDCKKGVAWDNAINLRLEPAEIGMILAVLIGQADRFRAAGHGEANDKWFQIEATSGKYAGALRLSINQARRNIAVSITYIDLLQVMGVVERAAVACLRTRPIATEVKLRRQAQLYALAAEAKEQGKEQQTR